MRRQKSHCSDRAFNQSDDRKWPNFVRAFVMYDRASPFGVAHFRRHGPLAFSMTPSRGSLDSDSGLRKAGRNEMAGFTNWGAAQHLGYLS